MKLLNVLFFCFAAFAGGLHAQQQEWPGVKRFAEDITDVIWDLRGTNNLKHLRFDGEDFREVTATGQSRGRYKVKPIVANSRVFEFVHEKDPTWVAFSADGTEAWWLNITDVFGGHAHFVPSSAALTSASTGLSAQHNDLSNHAMDLRTAGDLMRAATIVRELVRKNATNEVALRGLQARFGSLMR